MPRKKKPRPKRVLGDHPTGNKKHFLVRAQPPEEEPAPIVIPEELKATKKGFLQAYALTGNAAHSAELAGINVCTHHDWKRKDPVYLEAFKMAQKEANDRLEREARRRAVEGVKRLKFYKDQPILDPRTGEPYYEHEYSDTLLIFLLKATGGKFKEKKEIETKSSHVHQHEHRIKLDSLPLDIKKRLLEHLRSQKNEVEGKSQVIEDKSHDRNP